MKCHNRTINLSYFEHHLPTFKTSEEIDEWHRALGRLVAYGLQREAQEETVQFVHVTLDKDKDMTSVYYKPLPAYRHDVDGSLVFTGSRLQRVDDTLDTLRKEALELGLPFVLGAVLSNGKYGFHS